MAMGTVEPVSILLIDPNETDRQYYSQRLTVSSPDYQIFEATNGQTGLRLYQSCSIDCVVLELALPDMSGFEILVKLVPIAHHPEIAVIVLTHLPNAVLLDLALKNGAMAGLYKPRTSGDILNETVLKAVSKVQRDRKKVQ